MACFGDENKEEGWWKEEERFVLLSLGCLFLVAVCCMLLLIFYNQSGLELDSSSNLLNYLFSCIGKKGDAAEAEPMEEGSNGAPSQE